MRGALLALLLPVGAQAWEIEATSADPCHERLTLAAFDAIGAPWSADDDASLAPLLDAMAARAEALGVPGDRATRAFIDAVAERFGLGELPAARRFVLASLVAGVREPDTRGFSPVKLNETRETHIDEAYQAEHALRRSGDDDASGMRVALDQAHAVLIARFAAAHALWNDRGDPVRGARWTFAFYGEQEVEVFGPAFRLGQMAHTVQDAFTHVLRDAELRATGVANFVEAIQGGLHEMRDGIAHSARLDRCNVGESAEDAERFAAARRATAAVLAAAGEGMQRPDYPRGALDGTATPLFAAREGCGPANDYCDARWLDLAREEPTEPIRAWFCNAAPDVPGPAAPAFALAALGLWRLGRGNGGAPAVDRRARTRTPGVHPRRRTPWRRRWTRWTSSVRCAGASRARCASTSTRGRCMRPTRRTTARCPSASSSPARRTR